MGLCGGKGSIPSPVQWVQNPALLPLWPRFEPWPRNFGCGPKTRTRKHPHGQKLSNADFGDIVVQKNGTETKNPWWPLCKRVTESQTGLPDQATHAAAGHRSPSASQQLRRLKRRTAAPRAQVPALRAEDPPSPPRPLCRHSPIYGRLKNTG